MHQIRIRHVDSVGRIIANLQCMLTVKETRKKKTKKIEILYCIFVSYFNRTKYVATRKYENAIEDLNRKHWKLRISFVGTIGNEKVPDLLIVDLHHLNRDAISNGVSSLFRYFEQIAKCSVVHT